MIPGFIHDIECPLLASEALDVPANGVIVEIGSYLGKSTEIMARNSDFTVKLYAVDTWDNRATGDLPTKDTYAEFMENTKAFSEKIVPMRGLSSEMVKGWDKQIDLMFIDGDHSFAAVYDDLYRWIPFIRKGGVLLLHDYMEPTCGVKEAFERYAIKHFLGNTSVIGSILRVVV